MHLRKGLKLDFCRSFAPYWALKWALKWALYGALCPAVLFAGGLDSGRLARDYGNWFHQQVAREDIVGAAFAVVSREDILLIGTAGHATVGGSEAITENSPFRVASVSKTFAAGLTGMLVREGRLDWEDSVNDFVPAFRIKGDTSLITVRHVLGQSSGLVPHAYDNLMEDGVAVEEIIRQLGKLSYICTPGDCYTYQNSVFSLLEPVIEQATDSSYAELMSVRIFEPLDMRSASVGYESFVQNPERARPHVKSRGQWKAVDVKPNYYRLAPAAGVNASILDMAKWLQAMLGSHPSVFEDELLTELTTPRVHTQREMYRREWRNLLTNAHYGLGWRVYQLDNHTIAYHSGWVSGYRADVAWSEQLDVGIAILLNFESKMIDGLTTEFWKMAFADRP